MTKDERSLLLFLETCAVDYGGKIDARHMNKDDFRIAESWDRSGYLKFGRICYKDIPSSVTAKTHWVELSEDAWKDAHAERRARFDRIESKRTWNRTEDLNKDGELLE